MQGGERLKLLLGVDRLLFTRADQVRHMRIARRPQAVLGPVVMDDQCLGHIRCGGDRLERSPSEPVLTEQFDRGVQDPLRPGGGSVRGRLHSSSPRL